jgi:hypothetical protein
MRSRLRSPSKSTANYIGRGQELGLPDLACPIAAQFARRHIAAIDDAQQAGKLGPEPVGPPAIVSERRNRTDERKPALIDPEVGFKPPNAVSTGPGTANCCSIRANTAASRASSAVPLRIRSGEIIRPENCSNVWLKTR